MGTQGDRDMIYGMAQPFWTATMNRGEPEPRPTVRSSARQITYSLPPYQQDQQSTAYTRPGRGVSGETSN